MKTLKELGQHILFFSVLLLSHKKENDITFLPLFDFLNTQGWKSHRKWALSYYTITNSQVITKKKYD